MDVAIEDFVAVSGLEEMDSIRTRDQFRISELQYLNATFYLRTRKDTYLVKFNRRCHELNEAEVTADIRFDSKTLQSRFDTIRGCRIEKIFAIDEAAGRGTGNARYGTRSGTRLEKSHERLIIGAACRLPVFVRGADFVHFGLDPRLDDQVCFLG